MCERELASGGGGDVVRRMSRGKLLRDDGFERGDGCVRGRNVCCCGGVGVHGVSGGELLRGGGLGSGDGRVRGGHLLAVIRHGLHLMLGWYSVRVERGIMHGLHARFLPAFEWRDNLCELLGWDSAADHRGHGVYSVSSGELLRDGWSRGGDERVPRGPVLGDGCRSLRRVRERELASDCGGSILWVVPRGKLLRHGWSERGDGCVRGGVILGGGGVGVHGVSGGELLRGGGPRGGVGRVRRGIVPGDDGGVELVELLELPPWDVLGGGCERLLELQRGHLLVDDGVDRVRGVRRGNLL